jgi:hypothetical protein
LLPTTLLGYDAAAPINAVARNYQYLYIYFAFSIILRCFVF